jgi:hypothetical protein
MGIELTDKDHRTIRRAAILLITGMFLVMLTHLVRMRVFGICDKSVAFLFGVLPNFAAAFSLPFLVIALESLVPGWKTKATKRIRRLAFAMGATFIGLAAWEAVQYGIWKIPFDPNDILASLIGVAFSAILSIWVLKPALP